MGTPESDLHRHLADEAKQDRHESAVESAEIEIRDEMDISLYVDPDAEKPGVERWLWSIFEIGKPDAVWGDDWAPSREQALKDIDACFTRLAENRVEEWADSVAEDKATRHLDQGDY